MREPLQYRQGCEGGDIEVLQQVRLRSGGGTFTPFRCVVLPIHPPFLNVKRSIFDGLCSLFADVDVDVKNGANLLDRLIKDIVTGENEFNDPKEGLGTLLTARFARSQNPRFLTSKPSSPYSRSTSVVPTPT